MIAISKPPMGKSHPLQSRIYSITIGTWGISLSIDRGYTLSNISYFCDSISHIYDFSYIFFSLSVVCRCIKKDWKAALENTERFETWTNRKLEGIKTQIKTSILKLWRVNCSKKKEGLFLLWITVLTTVFWTQVEKTRLGCMQSIIPMEPQSI